MLDLEIWHHPSSQETGVRRFHHVSAAPVALTVPVIYTMWRQHLCPVGPTKALSVIKPVPPLIQGPAPAAALLLLVVDQAPEGGAFNAKPAIT
jgi:hypothetical protein